MAPADNLVRPTPPTVVVLLATFNGERFLQEQLTSILAQTGVEVRIVVLDDGSTDSTPQLLDAAAAEDDRITVLATREPTGSAAGNFYRLLLQADVADDALIALSDQDDIWMPDKLARHAAILQQRGADGVSSNVMAFDDRDRHRLIRKDYPQREFDYLLESPGPGSTFLMTGRLVSLVADILARRELEATAVDYHDWLIYAVCRARGWLWHIDGEPSVRYRQHDANVMGSNQGWRSALGRLRLIRSHWHRRQALRLALIAAAIADEPRRGELTAIADSLSHRTVTTRRTLMTLAPNLRRRPRDAGVIGALIALGIW